MKDFPNISQTKNTKLIRKQPESDIKTTVKLLLALIILIIVGFIFVKQRIEYIKTERNVNQLLLEKRKLNSEILPLKLEERYLTQIDKIEKIAKNQLKLQYPKKQQIIELDINKKSEE